MQGIHNRFDNGQTNATAAIFPGSGLIHLEEFDPYLVQILLWNWLTCIKDRNSYQRILPLNLDLNDLIKFTMVDRVADIIGYDFFYLKFIRPDIDRFLFLENQMNLLLIHKNFRRI